MAMDLFCYSSLTFLQVNEVLSNLRSQNQDLFEDKFIISDAKPSSEVGRETALEYGLQAQCLFLIRVNNKTSTELLPRVVDVVKNAFKNSNIVILFENENRR